MESRQETQRDEKLEGIGGGAFLGDEPALKVRFFSSGRGRLEGAPEGRGAGEPVVVCCPDGRLGWRVQVPGARPLSTPTVTGGRVFLGGGFGSHEFHAFDAAGGARLWTLRTKDDGPTAATAIDGLVAFNTESCTVYVVEAETGRAVWERWLGDPLMAQPAIGRSVLYMAYPDRGRRHQLAALRLADGTTLWESELVADVITAPIVAESSIYAASLDGTVYRIDPETGAHVWSINHGATSAPWVHRGRIFLSLREAGEDPHAGRGTATVEGWDTVVLGTGARPQTTSSSRRYAKYLDQHDKEKVNQWYAEQDANVGFASAPSSAKLHFAAKNLGLDRVSSVWSFQGSRPTAFDDGIFGVMGDAVQRLDLATKRPVWRCRMQIEGGESLGRVLSPPAMTAGRLYVTSTFGDLFVLDRSTGEELWALNVGAPILSQPAVSGGKVFIGTADGTLYAFQADDPDPVGWPMWGGGPGHNGAEV